MTFFFCDVSHWLTKPYWTKIKSVLCPHSWMKYIFWLISNLIGSFYVLKTWDSCFYGLRWIPQYSLHIFLNVLWWWLMYLFTNVQYKRWSWKLFVCIYLYFRWFFSKKKILSSPWSPCIWASLLERQRLFIFYNWKSHFEIKKWVSYFWMSPLK